MEREVPKMPPRMEIDWAYADVLAANSWSQLLTSVEVRLYTIFTAVANLSPKILGLGGLDIIPCRGAEALVLRTHVSFPRLFLKKDEANGAHYGAYRGECPVIYTGLTPHGCTLNPE